MCSVWAWLRRRLCPRKRSAGSSRPIEFAGLGRVEEVTRDKDPNASRLFGRAFDGFITVIRTYPGHAATHPNAVRKWVKTVILAILFVTYVAKVEIWAEQYVYGVVVLGDFPC